MKRKFILFLSLISSSLIYSQTEKDFPVMTGAEITGGKVVRTNYDDGTSLWGLIDGGADIYLEYGFDKLLFQEIEIKGLKFRVEIYRMTDDKAAFGIYSVSRYKCSHRDTLTKFICITPFQVQAAAGKFYLSISNETGDKETERITLNLFSKYLFKINGNSIALPELFTNKSFEPYKNRLKFIKGRLGVQNGFPAWIEMFEPYSDYEIYLLPVESENGFANIALIKFKSENEARKFIDENSIGSKNRITKTIKSVSAGNLIFIESDLPQEQIKIFWDND
jgi:hypothetical protein